MRKILVTGAAGFVGYHVAGRLLESGVHVVGLDNLNDYYSVQLKRDRLARLRRSPSFEFAPCDVADAAAMQALFDQHRFDRVVHLAAQAGVRHSLTHPHVYTRSNIEGFLNILEGARHTEVPHLVYASSSSVYGANTRLPFAVGDNVDHPISLYAATKKANELMAHSYSHLYRLPTTGLRFFTVYGPWGRPDMALWLFTKAILAGQPIQVFNEGRMRRDFTYVDDIVEAVVRVMDKIPSANPAWDGAAPDPASSNAPYRLYNIGNNRSVELLHLIETLEKCLGRKAKRELLPMQPGDVPETCADVDALMRDVGFRPDTPIETGISRFVEWYLEYHKVV